MNSLSVSLESRIRKQIIKYPFALYYLCKYLENTIK